MQKKVCNSILTILMVIVFLSGVETVYARSIWDVIFLENFEQYVGESLSADWWVEGCEKVWVEDGRLQVKANISGKNQSGYGCTVWLKQIFSGNLEVEFDAHVEDSSINANNINFFFLYSDPNGTPLYETRESRNNATYKMYHNLNGYIFTFLNDWLNERNGELARMRIRRNPGFDLMAETYDYHCRKGVTYHVAIKKVGSDLTFAVDGKVYLKGHDERAWTKGMIGLRTFQTDLWWDNIKVTQLK